MVLLWIRAAPSNESVVCVDEHNEISVLNSVHDYGLQSRNNSTSSHQCLGESFK